MNRNRYPYANGDPIVDRNSYFYSPATGAEFLATWHSSRDEALYDLAAKKATEPTRAVPRLPHELDSLIDQHPDNPESRRRFELIVKRFEVSKRIYGAYDANGKPTDPRDFDDLNRYLRFAEVLDRWFRSTQRLQYLNSLLKCLDTLAALRTRLDSTGAERLTCLIHSERNHVAALSHDRGVTAQ